MTPLFKKLNLGTHKTISVFNAPACFEPELRALSGIAVRRDPKKPAGIHFALAFATRQDELDGLSRTLAAGSIDDAVLWFAYPKGTSKRYQCEFNRDSGFGVIRASGFDSVRSVAIDADWSALRFRRNEFIKAR